MQQRERDAAVTTYQRLLAAWNARDAEAFAATFTADGSCIGFDGSEMNGRAEIAASLGGIFQSHQTASYVARVREVRELAPGVVLVRAVVGMTPPGASDLNPAVNAIQSVVVVANGEGIALLQNTPAAFHGRPELAARLTSQLREALQTGHTVTVG